MTPALDLLKKVRAEHRVHSYEHDPKAASYGLEAAEKLGLEPAQVFKTLLAASEKGELLVAVVPVVGSLDLKGLAHAAGVKKSRWRIRRRPSAPPVICWGASALWGRRNACVPSSIIRLRLLRLFMSAPVGVALKSNWHPLCWLNIPRQNSPTLVVREKNLCCMNKIGRFCHWR